MRINDLLPPSLGTLIHRPLEHAIRHKAAIHDDLRQLAMWLTVEEPQLRESLDEAIDTVERVARAEFWHPAKTGEHSGETPFAVMRAPGELTTGVIDLLFKSPEGWHVRDYQTDVALDAIAYERQLRRTGRPSRN